MTREYRVVWQREMDKSGPISSGGYRRSAIFQSEPPAQRKALMLLGRLCEAIGEDPEDIYCCGGDMCSCGGITWGDREEEFRSRDTMQPLVYLRIDSREVGPWRQATSEVPS